MFYLLKSLGNKMGEKFNLTINAFLWKKITARKTEKK